MPVITYLLGVSENAAQPWHTACSYYSLNRCRFEFSYLNEGKKKMKTNLTKKSLIIGAALLLMGAAIAFAGGGYRGGDGYGGHMMGYGSGYGMGPGMMGNGYGMGPGMMGYGPGYDNNGRGYGDNLSAEQRTKLDAAQEKFFAETHDLRNKIEDQRDALQEELSKDNPDAAKVGNLQKELSTLQAEFDQKAVQHQIEVRKVLPENFSGRGYGQGYGSNCWQQ